MKFAVLSSGATLESTQVTAIRKLLEIEGVQLEAVIETEEIHPLAPNSVRVPARKFVDISGLFASSARIPVRDIPAIQSRHLDFILNFAAAEPPAAVLALASAGVWTLRHGIDAPAGMAGFWEIYHGLDSISSRLERSGGGILRDCSVATDRTSYARTVDALLTAAAELPARAAKDLLLGRAPQLQPKPLPGRGGAPNLLQMSLCAAKRWGRWAKLQVDSMLFWENWGVGVVDAPIHRFLDPQFRPDVTWLPVSEALKFIADPFAIADSGGLTVFVEEFDYDRYQGYISALDLRNGQPPSRRVLIDEGVHMSYPFQITYQGERYCVPEMCCNYEVRLYRHEPAPNAWTRAATIITGFPALDPTILEYEDRWWLFCSCNDAYPDAKLYIWYADDLFGPWRPHWMNPVKCDITSSRPGGTPFLHEGALYRPAQDSSTGYGGALAINRVACLTPDDFAEETAIRIRPLRNGPYPEGIHTISAAGRHTMIDGKRKVFLAPLLKRKLAHKFGRVRQFATGR